tara:strand:- start:23 stop:268 length:246 start_codon:yes stop_codon:yes gene_type:complete
MSKEDTEKFLDWLVELDISYYKTTKEPDYIPSGNSHFYLKGSQERFTSKEMIDVFTNKASDEINENWQYAIAENNQWKKRQ